jgi:hypothetical protein
MFFVSDIKWSSCLSYVFHCRFSTIYLVLGPSSVTHIFRRIYSIDNGCCQLSKSYGKYVCGTNFIDKWWSLSQYSSLCTMPEGF